MPKRILIIDRDARPPLFLSVDGETVTIGGTPTEGAVVLKDLQISRIHCEIEVEDESVVISRLGGEDGAEDQQELHSGGSLHVGGSEIRFAEALADAEAVPVKAAPAPARLNEPSLTDRPLSQMAPATMEGVLPDLDEIAPEDLDDVATEAGAISEGSGAPAQFKRLMVIDGADQGRFASVPTSGALSIGNSHKHADFVLHDLYVSRVHCELVVQGDKIFVNHIEGAEGTLINKQRIKGRQEMRLGDVLRVGNSHLRLEAAVVEEKAADKAADEESFEVIEEVQDKATQIAESLTQLAQLENQTLGHYKIGPLLGRGHAGVVFTAQDLKTKQMVALKVLAPAFPANDAELQRFIKTLKVTIPLHHPSLVAVYTGGRSGSNCWIARELIDGDSLDRRIERLKEKGPWNWKRAGRVALHLAEALAFLEEREVSHGNVTPRNILIRKSDKLTKLTDLGLTQSLAGSELEEAIAEKKPVEELPYLAPERLSNNANVEPIPADLYSVGAVVYTLLTGQPPFSGKSAEVLIARIQNAHVVKPTKVQRDIPVAFEGVVLKLLAKDPADRYQTAAELVEALEPLTADD